MKRRSWGRGGLIWTRRRGHSSITLSNVGVSHSTLLALPPPTDIIYKLPVNLPEEGLITRLGVIHSTPLGEEEYPTPSLRVFCLFRGAKLSDPSVAMSAEVRSGAMEAASRGEQAEL
eukprot:753414-Hanusia_phi.AAC.10